MAEYQDELLGLRHYIVDIYDEQLLLRAADSLMIRAIDHETNSISKKNWKAIKDVVIDPATMNPVHRIICIAYNNYKKDLAAGKICAGEQEYVNRQISNYSRMITEVCIEALKEGLIDDESMSRMTYFKKVSNKKMRQQQDLVLEEVLEENKSK